MQKDCGGDQFPEEYYQCADVEILPARESDVQSTTPSTTAPARTPVSAFTISPGNLELPAPYVPEPTPLFQKFLLVADGEVITDLPDGAIVGVKQYQQISIQVVTTHDVATFVDFFLDGRKVWTEYKTPYFLYGDDFSVPKYWKNPIVDRPFKLRVESDGNSMEASISLVK